MRKRLLAFTMAFVALFSLLTFYLGCGRDQGSQEPGERDSGRQVKSGPANFALRDLQGQIFRMKDYRQKTVLLIFGTTWCPSCRSEIPHFKQIYGKYAPRGLEVAYVNIQEPQDKVARFSAKYQLPYRTLLDSSGEVAASYGIRGVPAMALLKDGKILTLDYRLIDGYLEKIFPR